MVYGNEKRGGLGVGWADTEGVGVVHRWQEWGLTGVLAADVTSSGTGGFCLQNCGPGYPGRSLN